MKPDQKSIYYLTADTLAAARNSPHLEGFRAKGIEVLLLTDRIDEWVANHLHEFDGKPLASASSAAADVASAIETPDQAAAESEYKDSLGASRQGACRQDRERADFRPAHRIPGGAWSPANSACPCAWGVYSSRRVRTIRSRPCRSWRSIRSMPLIERLKATDDDAAFADLATVLYDQALLAEGGELDDPASYVRRVNKLIVEGFGRSRKSS
jgi:molecular chaperone HtpG